MSVQKKYYLFLSGILALLIGMLFQETFFGMVLQGVDDNVSMRQVLVRSLLSGQGYHFIPNYWLGFIFNVPNPDFYNTFLALTGSTKVAGIYILALVLSGFVTFKLIRRLDISPLSAIFGSISYTFLPHVLSLVYSGHALAIEAIPMTPGFLLCISVICDGKTESRLFKSLATIWAGIFWAWMMIGEPQRGIYGSILGVSWAIYLLFKQNVITFKPKITINYTIVKKYLPLLLLSAIIGILIFLSTIKFWANSEFLQNQGSWEFSTSWSFPPNELIDTLAFGYHGLSSSDPYVFYWGDKPMSGNTDSLGFMMFVFMILGVIFGWKTQKTDFKFFLIAGIVALLLSFGKYMPGTPFYWLWYHLPGMDKLRVPAKFLSITGLAWSIVAAMGLDVVNRIFASDDQRKKKTIFMICAIATLLSLFWFISLALNGGGDPSVIRKILQSKLPQQRIDRELIDLILSGRLNSILNMTVMFGLLFGGVAVIYKWNKFVPFFSGFIIFLTVINLYLSNRYYIEKTYINEQSFYKKTETINFLKNHLTQLYRASGSLFLPNTTKGSAPLGTVVEQGLYDHNNTDLTYAFPYHDINMFGRIPVSRIDDNYYNFFKSAYDSVAIFQTPDDIWAMNKNLWFLGNVKYIILSDQMVQLFETNLQKDARYITNTLGTYNQTNFIFELKNKLPRFALIDKGDFVYDLYQFDKLTEALQNISNFRIVLEESGVADKLDGVEGVLEADVHRYDYNSYEITLNNTVDKIFYFGDLFDKGWNAELDGESIPIYHANGIQQYMYIPAGSKKLKIFYKRPVEGLLLSRLFIIFAILAAIILFVKENILVNKSKK